MGESSAGLGYKERAANIVEMIQSEIDGLNKTMKLTLQ